MKVSFACPSCGASGSIDAVHVGKQVRCRHCKASFAIPDPDNLEPDIYALEESADQAPAIGAGPSQSRQDNVFVPARADERAGDRPRRKQSSVTKEIADSIHRSTSRFPWRAWLIRGVLPVLLILTGIAILAPDGTWLVGCILVGAGGLLVPVGYFAGAYGAFSEDILYGFLYLAIPLYAGYYLVTRWEDLWIWLTCSTVGVGLVMVGTELIRWTGEAV
jgi:hypothetical protein